MTMRTTMLALGAMLALTTSGLAIETKAGQALLVDHASGTTLFAKDADKLVPPASLAKLMTIEIVFDMLERGRLKPDELVRISENAWRTGGGQSGGSAMFLEVRSQVPVEDLLNGIVIQSGNDASIALAEHIAGTEDAFAQLMNERARKIGLTNSTFRNSTGLPHPEQNVTMRDMVTLAEHIYTTYPERYDLFAREAFEWNGIRQRNRNPLLDENLGADGLKTGHTQASGYALVASAVPDDDRLFLAVSGLSSAAEREREAVALLRWGSRSFERRRLFGEDEPVGEARVYGGSQRSVPLVARGGVEIFLPLTERNELRARVVYEGPVEAPIAKGQRIGVLRVTKGDEVTQETPLYAGTDIAVGPLHLRALDAAQEALAFWR